MTSISTLPPGAAGAAGTTAADAKTRKAAEDFESMTISQMLEPMFDTVDTSGGMFGGGVGESSFKPMLISEMAKQMEQRGGLGLADSIYSQMLKMQEKAS